MPSDFEKLIPETLRGLMDHAGLKYSVVSRRLGYPHASGFQRYYTDGARKRAYLPMDLVTKLRRILVGRGDPPITDEEVLALGGVTTGGFVTGDREAAPEATRQRVSLGEAMELFRELDKEQQVTVLRLLRDLTGKDGTAAD